VPPPIDAPPPPLVAIAAVAVDVSIAVDDDALDNNSNIFYSKDFSSKLVTTRMNGGNLSHKAVPVCFLASSVSVDVLGLMHERTGHFHKRGLIECVRSKIKTFGNSKIPINTSVISVPERKPLENHLKRFTRSEESCSGTISLWTLQFS
jgi:hypothetical protein